MDHFRATDVESVRSVELILKLSPGRQPLPNLHSGDTPLLVACRIKNYEIATLLLAHSPKLLLMQNKESRHSAMHLSVLNGDSKMIHLLIGHVRQLFERKELVHESNYLLDFFDIKGVTPLFIACQNGHKEIVKILVDLLNEFSDVFNINRAIGENKETPLHVAVETCSVDVVRALLNSKDIDVNIRAKPSKNTLEVLGSKKPFHEIYITPLAEASVYGCKAIVELLLQHGAVDKDGLACTFCCSLSNVDLEQTILSYHCTYGVVCSAKLRKKRSIPDTAMGLTLAWNSMNLEVCNRAWLNERVHYIATANLTENADIASTVSTSKLAKYDYRAVKVVNLCQNSLSEVPLELFCLPNVVEINISHNMITALPMNQYTCLNSALCGWDCKYLELLNLSHNELKEFPSCIWMLPNLREIHCEVNHLVIVPDPSLNQVLGTINLIDFSKNRLKSVSEMIWLSKSLKEFNLSGNDLSITSLNFPPSVKVAVTQELADQETDMSIASTHNQAIIQSKSASSGYESVEELTFGYRRNVEFFECHYSSLYKLSIANSGLTEFPEALPCIAPNLSELDVSDNVFDSIDIQLIPQLTTKFVARNCKIRSFGNVLEKNRHDSIVTNCCHSSVIENNSASLCQHRSHQQLPFLKELDLSKNSLTQIQLIHHSLLNNPEEDPAIKEKVFLTNTSSTILLYPNLENLNLEWNNLTGSFNPNVGHLSHLKSLLLSGNSNLQTLPNELGMLDLSVLGIQYTPSLIDPPQEYQMVESRDNLSHLLHFLKARLRK